MKLLFIKNYLISINEFFSRVIVCICPAQLNTNPNPPSKLLREIPNLGIYKFRLYEKQLHVTMLVKNNGALLKRKGV